MKIFGNVKIFGVVAINHFPLWRKALDALYSICDGVVVRFDGLSGDPEILHELLRIQKQEGSRLMHVEVVKTPWQCPEWREEGLRMLDEFKPDIVLCPDEDEVFDDALPEELKAFWESDKKGMMFMYHPLESSDGREINRGMPYPPEPHMKAYKWEPMLCYYPYHGNAVLARYRDKAQQWQAKTKIRHYCAYTPAMEHAKHWRSDTPKGRPERAVTLIGFGPSSQKDMEPVGEIWSLNNCYEQFPEEMMKRVTRIYEMHQEHKRDRLIAKDGNLHFWHLNRLGRLGHRIVMQKPLPNIYGSEGYPLMDVMHRFPFNHFHGTPPYMVAHAIMDGFTHIRIYGFDQMDWEHRIQRECFGFWTGFAAGMGIKVSGRLTFMEQDKRLYGYDYGPEWDEISNKVFWSAFPFEMKMKFESRAMKGELFDGDK